MIESNSIKTIILIFLASGCCRWNDNPLWYTMDSIQVADELVEIDLEKNVLDDRGKLDFEVSSSNELLIAWTEDNILNLQPQPDWKNGSSAILTLTVTDRCDAKATTEVAIAYGEPDTTETGLDTPCETVFSYNASGDPEAVYVAGSFNDWSSTATPMEIGNDGSWKATIELTPGAYPYKFVVVQNGTEQWTCDPESELIHCDEDYTTPETSAYWDHTCGTGVTSCNSLMKVQNCSKPTLKVASLDIDRTSRSVKATVECTLNADNDEITTATATLNGESIDAEWDGSSFKVNLTGLSETRHTLRFTVTDASGNKSQEAYIPFWMDERSWNGGLMYYAFVDRLSNGDSTIDSSEGASFELASYMGGDFQGLIDMLPYLDDLGVTVLWISNPQDNAEGAFAGDCGTYSGYHAYWPDAAREVEEHFGGDSGLKKLVEEAHELNMRVVMDWVANHVHEDHPYYQDHESDGWFTDPVMCKIGDDYSNFDKIPETCWFAEYLPDIRYYEPDPLDQFVEDALWWIKTYEFDGFRVDGAKHVPHSVVWNLHGRLAQEIEHSRVGGDEDFYTVGETFTPSRDWITAYMGSHQLDAQFDFPLYYSIRNAFIDYSISIDDLVQSSTDSETAYGNAVMSAFLGNHDVSRFISYTTSGGWADSSDSACITGSVPTEWDAYAKLNLAWVYLMTQPGLPLVYYGDEIGMPGYKDPSNRAPLWWYSSGIGNGESTLSDVSAGLYDSNQKEVLWTVSNLGLARREHPSFYMGNQTRWWTEENLYAYARTYSNDGVLVVLNRSYSDKSLTNGLSFAGLSDGNYEDVLTGDIFTASGDSITVDVDALSARVLVKK